MESDDEFPSVDDLLKKICDQVEQYSQSDDVIGGSIDFKSFCRANKSLDLLVPLFINADEARCGCQKTLRWTQSIYTTSIRKYIKIKNTIVVDLPAHTRNGHKITWPEKGDGRDGVFGELIVTVIFKEK